MLDEDLSEDVDGSQSAQRDGSVTRPHQIDPKYAGQVSWTHPVHETLLRHLRGATVMLSTITLFYLSGGCASCPVWTVQVEPDDMAHKYLCIIMLYRDTQYIQDISVF